MISAYLLLTGTVSSLPYSCFFIVHSSQIIFDIVVSLTKVYCLAFL